MADQNIKRIEKRLADYEKWYRASEEWFGHFGRVSQIENELRRIKERLDNIEGKGALVTAVRKIENESLKRTEKR